MPATTVAASALADQANRCESSALTCRARLHSRYLSPRRPSEQRRSQTNALAYRPATRVTEPTPTKGKEVKPDQLPYLSARIHSGLAQADQKNRGTRTDVTCPWLSLAVVICLSQRLCRAFHSASNIKVKQRMDDKISYVSLDGGQLLG